MNDKECFIVVEEGKNGLRLLQEEATTKRTVSSSRIVKVSNHNKKEEKALKSFYY